MMESAKNLMVNLSFRHVRFPLRFLFLAVLFANIYSPSVARTTEEFAAIFVAPKHYLEPKKLFEYGYDLGLASSCKTISSQEISSAKFNLKRWVKIASTDYEPISSPGVFNKRLFEKAFGVLEKGEALGKKEGKKLRNNRSFRNDFCPFILDTFDAPPGELGK